MPRRRTRGRASALAAALLLAVPGAAAFEAAVSLGVDDVRGDPAPAAAVELRLAPFLSRPRVELALAAAAEADSDLWVGAGATASTPLAEPWRLEASVMLGAHFDGGGNDLGRDVPIFRSQVGVSRAVGNRWRVGLAVNHKSNAGTGRRNPGVETLLVTLARRF